jgi:hypothetical protein
MNRSILGFAAIALLSITVPIRRRACGKSRDPPGRSEREYHRPCGPRSARLRCRMLERR